MTNRILLVLFLLNLLQLGYAQQKVKPSLAKGTFSRQIGYGMLNGSIVGSTTLLFGSALSFEAAEKLPFWGATLATSTAIGWYLTGTEGCCQGIFKAYSDAGNDPDYQGSRWLTRLAVGLSTPVMLAGIAVGLSSELIGPEGRVRSKNWNSSRLEFFSHSLCPWQFDLQYDTQNDTQIQKT